MKILEVEQGSPEWRIARAGIPTSSNFDKIITSAGTPSKQQTKYIYQLAGERVTGVPNESHCSAAMERGKELETEARALYEVTRDVEVQTVGLVLADGYAASPDGLVGDDGLIEIKCPLIHTHIEYILSGRFPVAYHEQVQGQMLVTGRNWCDFMSYYPGLKPFIVRVYREERFLSSLSTELEFVCKNIEDIVTKIS